jgi:hypothetical protein
VNDRITAGAMVLMVDLAAAAQLARWYVRPLAGPGRHRMPKPPLRDVLDEVTLQELLPPWPEPETPYGAAVAQGWRWCPNCVRTEPAVLNRHGWTCGHCLEAVPADTTTITTGARP